MRVAHSFELFLFYHLDFEISANRTRSTTRISGWVNDIHSS